MHANPGSPDDRWVPGDVAQAFASPLPDRPRTGTNDGPLGCPEGGVTNVSPPEARPFQIASDARRQGAITGRATNT
jgi:hypothetical protein